MYPPPPRILAVKGGARGFRLLSCLLVATALQSASAAAIVYVMPTDQSMVDRSPCSGTTCLLQDDRFRVKARYSRAGGPAQSAGAVEAALADSAGLFSAGSKSPELLVRIVNQCRTTGYWEVYAGVASDAAFSVAVRHLETNQLKWFRTRNGQSIADTEAFACTRRDDRASPARPGSAADGAACSGVTCLLQDDRFRVKTRYVRADGQRNRTSRAADAIAADLGESAGLFTFDSGNPELLVRVVNRCGTSGYWAIFAGTASDAAFSVAVRHLETNQLKWFRSSRGRPVADSEAFECVTPSPELSYIGHVSGFFGGADEVEAVLTGPGTLEVTRPDSAGHFEFHDIPAGRFAIKVAARGYRTTSARIVDFPFPEVVDRESYEVSRLPADPFTYHWEEDQTTAGTEYSSNVVQPPVVQFDGETVEVGVEAAAQHLRAHYNILLVGLGWSQEHAFRLLDTMEDIPQPTQPASVWRLTDDFIDGDITIAVSENGAREVTISSAAFVNAAPRVASVDGKRGVWFSRRLHHAAVRFVTDNGRDEEAYERIFQERYGVTTRIDDYRELTLPTGGESRHNFQPFQANEILLLINMLEEMPAGMRSVDGMTYLVRRLNGLRHPLYPTSAAVAWPTAGYVEFMELAFRNRTENHMHRLIVHEKAHFLWEHLFDDQLKEDWIELGGWYEDGDAESGWSTTKNAEFVSAYAHLKDPDEDMAETISFFIVNPDRLRARSTAKYEFVRDRIMQGDIYVARIREDLTFEVYNLFPDYVYPGKIRRVDITVAGGPAEDKKLTVDLELHVQEGWFEGATRALTRLTSEVGTHIDLYLLPLDERGNYLPRGEEGTRLRGEYTLSKYLKAGYWVPLQVILRDSAGNERYQRASDFGWMMHVDNPLEDWTPPEYVPSTLAMSTSVWEEDGTVQVIHVDWLVNEDTAMSTWQPCYAAINDNRPDTYSFAEYGLANAAIRASHECGVDFLMPNYMPSSTYTTNSIAMQDVALNRKDIEFTGDRAVEAPPNVELETTNPDTEPPEVDLNRIRIGAEPTNPLTPNGETRVTVSFPHRDNISGLAVSSLLLRDPQGGDHFHYIYPDDRNDLYPRRDPTGWRVMERVVVLPPGSIPGTWGLAELLVYDRAGNSESYNFVEIVRFVVEDDS
ncbi:MAG: hypothetical protein OXG72_00570 [Acidobacteria bacterium]|nr:hypothetical protein [Acidobacteriota bacterium]